jgi:mono/diheme cytochrome c family protein
MTRTRARLLPLLLVGLAFLAAGCELFRPRPPGEKLWRRLCADCHGLDGAGNTVGYMGNPTADLLDDGWKYGGGDPNSIEEIVRQGIFAKMPAHDELTGEQMHQLLDYFYSLRGENPGEEQ